MVDTFGKHAPLNVHDLDLSVCLSAKTAHVAGAVQPLWGSVAWHLVSVPASATITQHSAQQARCTSAALQRIALHQGS